MSTARLKNLGKHVVINLAHKIHEIRLYVNHTWIGSFCTKNKDDWH